MTAKRKKERGKEKCFPSPAWELAGVRGRGVSQAQKTRRMGVGREDCFVSKKLLPPSFPLALENRGRKRRRLQPSPPIFGVTHRRSKWEKCRSGRRTSVYQIKSHLQIGGGGRREFFPLLWCGVVVGVCLCGGGGVVAMRPDPLFGPPAALEAAAAAAASSPLCIVSDSRVLRSGHDFFNSLSLLFFLYVCRLSA